MYVTVSRLMSPSGLIIDADYSFNPDKIAAQQEAIKSHNWVLNPGEYINTSIEWAENQQMMQK